MPTSVPTAHRVEAFELEPDSVVALIDDELKGWWDEAKSIVRESLQRAQIPLTDEFPVLERRWREGFAANDGNQEQKHSAA